MDLTTVVCPKCQHEFGLSAAIEQPMLERLRAQAERETEQKVQARVAAERTRLTADAERAGREAGAREAVELKEQLALRDKQIGEARAAEMELRKASRKLQEERESFELDKQRAMDAEREKIRKEATAAAAERGRMELKALEERLNASDERARTAEGREMALNKRAAELEAKEKAREAELARREEAARAEEAKKKDEEFRLKEAAKDKTLADMTRQIDELRRKAEQGSQQTQGEVLELDLEESLRRAFAVDDIRPVPKGVLGADVLHVVKDERGSACGSIIWEFKNTKAWGNDWIAKLKDDKLAAKAHIAVLISMTLPKELTGFECRDGVWVAPMGLAVALGSALRHALIETSRARRAMEGRHDNMAAVYDYLSGSEFRSRITAIVDSFEAMRKDLHAEKQAMEKIWAKREMQINRMTTNTMGLRGELEGIMGRELPVIEAMELRALGAGGEEGKGAS